MRMYIDKTEKKKKKSSPDVYNDTYVYLYKKKKAYFILNYQHLVILTLKSNLTIV